MNMPPLRITGLLALRRLFGGSGSEKPQSVSPKMAQRLYAVFLRQILGALETQRLGKNGIIAFAFPYSGT